MTTVGVLGTFEHHAENSEVAARAMERGGMRVVRIHRDEPLRSKLRKTMTSDVIYGTGFGFAWKLFLIARIAGKRTINHWMGTDVLIASTNPRMRSMASLAARFISVQLTQAPWLANELVAVGIKASVLPIVTDLDLRPLRSTSGSPGILTYLPDERAEFYGASRILQLAEAFPELPFCVVAGESGPRRPNIRYCGWVDDLGPLFEAYPILVRMAQHDGLPKMVLEALSIGNQVIFNYAFPHCHLAATHDEATSALSAILMDGCRTNAAGHDHIAKHYDPIVLQQELLSIVSPHDQ